MKKRIDLILVEKKLAETRTKAQAMIRAGKIFVNDRKILKSGEIHNTNEKIVVNRLYPEWVSRGAFKLLHALDNFKIDVTNFICLDIGASTGGFTQVLLSKKVKKIYSVDVGTDQLHDKLIKNPKVINMPKTNGRFLNQEIIPDIVDIIVCDVSFISMKKVIMPSLSILNQKSGCIVGLIKPQFESSKNEIKRGGIITDKKIHERICNEYKEWFVSECNMRILGLIESPIKGPKGNIEFLIYAKI